MSAPFSLRDYQHETGTAARAAFDAGIWSQMVVLPTGAGKTVIFSRLSSYFRDWLDSFSWINSRMLVIAHRDELIDQAATKIREANPDLNVEIEQSDRVASPMADIVVASIQTLAARGCKRLLTMNPNRFRVIVVDEAHHAAAESYQSVFRLLSLIPPVEMLPSRNASADSVAKSRADVRAWRLANPPGRLVIGFTATPSRADAIGLEWTFQQVVYEKSLLWMIERGYLVPPRGFLIDTDVNLDIVKTIGGDWQTAGLASVVNTPEINRKIVHAWAHLAHVDTTPKGRGFRAIDLGAGNFRRSLFFGVDVQHTRDLAAALRSIGVRADSVAGSDDDRDLKIARIRSGELDALVNCQLLTEGVDIPEVSCVGIARPTQSQALYMQIVGRGLRLFDGKSDALILDCVGISRKHSLVTLGDLFGLPPRFDLDGENAVQAAIEVERIRDDYPSLDLDGGSLGEIRKRINKIDLWNHRESKIVGEYASLKWIEDNASRYHLPVPQLLDGGKLDHGSKERIYIERDALDAWRVSVRGAADHSDFPIAMADDIASAFLKGEKWISMNRHHLVAMKAKDAPWRDRPPTTKQLDALKRMKCPIVPMTRGQASDLFDSFMAKKKPAKPA